MEVLYKQNALDTLYEIANFVESKNTKGSGYRFIEKFLNSLQIILFQMFNINCVNIQNSVRKVLVAFFFMIGLLLLKLKTKHLLFMRLLWEHFLSNQNSIKNPPSQIKNPILPN